MTILIDSMKLKMVVILPVSKDTSQYARFRLSDEFFFYQRVYEMTEISEKIRQGRHNIFFWLSPLFTFYLHTYATLSSAQGKFFTRKSYNSTSPS